MSSSVETSKTKKSENSDSEFAAIIKSAARDKGQIRVRRELARFAAKTFSQAGNELHVVGHLFGTDRLKGVSPGGNGSDEIVAVSLLLRIAGQLTSACADLFADGRHYAAAALLRQMVEVEYLAWAFQTRDKDAERWLRSTEEDRRNFFTPAKLRKAAQGKFRGQDYGHHCELGGHPVPRSAILFQGDEEFSQLLLSDLLGHAGRAWDHLLDWSAGNEWAIAIHGRREAMFTKYRNWKNMDKLACLPPPPSF